MSESFFPSDEVNGGPAYPSGLRLGMTLRDYFAGAALTGFLADPSVPHDKCHPEGKFLPLLASMAYQLADAMLAEREKR